MKKLLIAAITIACVGAMNASPPGTHDAKNVIFVEEAITELQPITAADVGKCHYVVPLTIHTGEAVLANCDVTITGGAPCPTGQQAISGMKDASTAGKNKAPCPKNGALMNDQAITVTAKLQVPVDVGKTTPCLFAATTAAHFNQGRHAHC